MGRNCVLAIEMSSIAMQQFSVGEASFVPLVILGHNHSEVKDPLQTLFLNLSPSAIKARNGLESKGCRITLQGFSHWRKLFPRIWHFSTVHPELKQFSVPLEMRTPLPLLRLYIVLLAGLRGFSVNKDNFFSLTKKTCSATFKPRTGFTLYHFTCKKKKRVERSFFFFLSLGNVTSLSASEVSTFPLLEMESCFSQLEAGIPFPLCFGSPH